MCGDGKTHALIARLENGTSRGVFGGEHFVLYPIHKEAVVLPAVGVEGMSQRHQLDGLTLGTEAEGGHDERVTQTGHSDTEKKTETLLKIEELLQLALTLYWYRPRSQILTTGYSHMLTGCS